MDDTALNNAASRARRRRRLGLWAALVELIAIAQSLLVALTLNYESSRAQEQIDTAAPGFAAEIKQRFASDQQSLQALQWNDPAPLQWQAEAAALLRERRALVRIERRDAQLRVVQSVDSPYQSPLFRQIRRDALEIDTALACNAAKRLAEPVVSRSFYVPMPNGYGLELVDLCLPSMNAGRAEEFVTASFALQRILEEAISADPLRSHELSFVESDSTRLARAGSLRGRGASVAERIVDLPGASMLLRVDSHTGRAQLIPNLTLALVLGLSAALGIVVLLLVRDARRRAGVEGALAEALAFRKAMEDSLVTGLRARDREGRVTYVNPAFCEMTGFSAAELIGQRVPPYWPPELVENTAAARTRACKAPCLQQRHEKGLRPPSCGTTVSVSPC